MCVVSGSCPDIPIFAAGPHLPQGSSMTQVFVSPLVAVARLTISSGWEIWAKQSYATEKVGSMIKGKVKKFDFKHVSIFGEVCFESHGNIYVVIVSDATSCSLIVISQNRFCSSDSVVTSDVFERFQKPATFLCDIKVDLILFRSLKEVDLV